MNCGPARKRNPVHPGTVKRIDKRAGIANQRKAIIEGLQGSIEQFQKGVPGASTSDVMQLVMITQYFDTIKSIGEMDKTNTLFLSHSPGAVRDISEQIMQSMLVADRAKS